MSSALVNPALRNLTALSAAELREMKPESLRALATKNGISADGPTQAVFARIMVARTSESRRLGHISRGVVKAEYMAAIAGETSAPAVKRDNSKPETDAPLSQETVAAILAGKPVKVGAK